MLYALPVTCRSKGARLLLPLYIFYRLPYLVTSTTAYIYYQVKQLFHEVVAYIRARYISTLQYNKIQKKIMVT